MDEKVKISLNDWLQRGFISKTQFDEICQFEKSLSPGSSLHKSHDHWTTYHNIIEEERKTYHLKNIYDEHKRTHKLDA